MRNMVLLFLLFSGLHALAQTDSSLDYLEGRWYIQLSNFPMWLNGNKTHPTFNYTIVEKSKKRILKDEVKFLKHKKEKTISGFDYPVNGNSTFVWKGEGLLRIAKSKWEVIYYDAQLKYAVIRFRKTLFTPAGIDIITRERQLSPEMLKAINKQLRLLGVNEILSSIPQN